MTLHSVHRKWLEERGLDPDFLAEKYGVDTRKKYGGSWITVPFIVGDQTVNHKYRATSRKDHRMDKDAKKPLWNANVLNDPEGKYLDRPVIITEGEWDALAVAQSGCRRVVSVPNGGDENETEGDPAESKRYDWYWLHKDELDAIPMFIIATDADAVGRAMANDLARLLGPERCKFVAYPEGCKDFNDVLLAYSDQRVREVVAAAKPWPIQGLYKFSDFPDQEPIPKRPIGIEGLDEHISLVFPALYVISGYANIGKSTLVDIISARCIEQGLNVCRGEFEGMPKPILQDEMRCALLSCGKGEMRNHPDLPKVDRLLEERMDIITQLTDSDKGFDVSGFLNTARASVLQNNTRVIILDPWIELEHKKDPREMMTEYVGREIQRIKAFMRQYSVAFFIVAHPAKPMPGYNGAPGLYDISDSAHWANKPDYGLIYHRTKNQQKTNLASILITKVRRGYPGKRGRVDVAFDFRDHNFHLAEMDEE